MRQLGRVGAEREATLPREFYMGAGALTVVGGSQPHPNMAPSLVVNFCITLQGIFPSRN